WFCYWWLDRYEPEPRRYKIAAFVWGGVVAVGIALALQIFIQDTWNLSDETMASVVAPLTEEPAKCLFLLLTFIRWRRVIDGFLDGLVYAGIVGIGFAFIENIGYYLASYLGSPDIKIAGAEGATTTFIVRGIFSPFAHPLFTSAFGIALGVAVMVRSKILKTLIVVLGLAASAGLHALWNSSLSYGGAEGFVLAYLALGGLLFLLGVFAIVVRVRQVRVLESSLAYVSERGWIHPAEIPYLSRFGYRRAARRYAKKHHGKVAFRAVRRYQALATQMSFLHAAMMSGRTMPHGVERTYALLPDCGAVLHERDLADLIDAVYPTVELTSLDGFARFRDGQFLLPLLVHEPKSVLLDLLEIDSVTGLWLKDYEAYSLAHPDERPRFEIPLNYRDAVRAKLRQHPHGNQPYLIDEQAYSPETGLHMERLLAETGYEIF
ncbi:MAG: PrsW family intramembrane metalloprotease, partial [Deltaproteobacteria bacterium]